MGQDYQVIEPLLMRDPDNGPPPFITIFYIVSRDIQIDFINEVGKLPHSLGSLYLVLTGCIEQHRYTTTCAIRDWRVGNLSGTTPPSASRRF